MQQLGSIRDRMARGLRRITGLSQHRDQRADATLLDDVFQESSQTLQDVGDEDLIEAQDPRGCTNNPNIDYGPSSFEYGPSSHPSASVPFEVPYRPSVHFDLGQSSSAHPSFDHGQSSSAHPPFDHTQSSPGGIFDDSLLLHDLDQYRDLLLSMSTPSMSSSDNEVGSPIPPVGGPRRTRDDRPSGHHTPSPIPYDQGEPDPVDPDIGDHAPVVPGNAFVPPRRSVSRFGRVRRRPGCGT